MRLIKYAAVGGSGVLVNLGLLHIGLYFGLTGALSSILAGLGAMTGNYILNMFVTWKGQRKHRPIVQTALYYGISGAGIMTTSGVFLFLHWSGVNPYASQFAGIVCTSLWTFTAHSQITFGRKIDNEGPKQKRGKEKGENSSGIKSIGIPWITLHRRAERAR